MAAKLLLGNGSIFASLLNMYILGCNIQDSDLHFSRTIEIYISWLDKKKHLLLCSSLTSSNHVSKSSFIQVTLAFFCIKHWIRMCIVDSSNSIICNLKKKKSIWKLGQIQWQWIRFNKIVKWIVWSSLHVVHYLKRLSTWFTACVESSCKTYPISNIQSCGIMNINILSECIVSLGGHIEVINVL